MKAEPFNNKRYKTIILDTGEVMIDAEVLNGIKSAVEWLKEKISEDMKGCRDIMDLPTKTDLFEHIDIAFADVVEVKE